MNYKTVCIGAACAAIAACGDPGRDAAIIRAVKAEAGGSPNLMFSHVSWCADTVNGNRAAIVSAVGPMQAASDSGAGGYFVEVLAEGTLGTTVKASPPDGSPSSEALRIDKTYCQGQLVAGPQEAFDRLEQMSRAHARPY